MTHSDPDALAMLALGDPDVDEADVQHVMGCEVCRSELDRLMRVTRAARENGPVDFELREPSPVVWEGIRAQLTMEAPDASAGVPDPEPAPAEPSAPPAPPAHVAPQRRGRSTASRRRWVAALSGAAVLLVAVVVAAVLVLRPTAQVQAHATLAGLPAWSTSSGTATMERQTDGTTVLQIELDSPAVHSSGDYREVWLMNSDLTKSISVGLLDGDSGTFAMPPNIAAADYPVVDISQQPLNGDPAHSGDSIVRGTLASG